MSGEIAQRPTAEVEPVPSTAGATSTPNGERVRGRGAAVLPFAWAKQNLFASWWSTVVTLGLGAVILLCGVRLFEWAVLNAVWSVPYNAEGRPVTDACQSARGVGACWAVVADKYRLILFGRYPYPEQWRPALCVLLFLGLYAVSAMRRFWRRELGLIWVGTLAVIGLLMWGGVPGLPFVAEDSWGGLPLTLILATFGLAFSFPLAVLVARAGVRPSCRPCGCFACCMSN